MVKEEFQANPNVEIVHMQGESLYQETAILNRLVEINTSVNDLYSPTLQARYKADTLEVLKEKVYQRMLERIGEGYDFYLLYVDGEIIGFNNHRVAITEIYGTKYTTLEIGTTTVHVDKHNMGYGKYIYSYIEMDAKLRYNIEAVVRNTWSTNLKQLHLYHTFGYEEYIIYKNYYGIHGLHMLKFCKVLNDVWA